MSARFVINALDFVRNAEVHRGKIACAELERLQDYLSDNRGELEYTVNGVLGSNGRPILRITVKGIINLQCQRCLAGLAHVLDVRADLLLAENESEFSRLDEEESVDVVLAAPDLDVLALIEDEIILNLPISPRHPEGECSLGELTGDDTTGRKHLFSALATLKKLH